MGEQDPAITALERMMNREQPELEKAFLSAELAPLFEDGGYRQERGDRVMAKMRRRDRQRQANLACDLMDRACRVLADARLRGDLPAEIQRACAIVHAAGYLGA